MDNNGHSIFISGATGTLGTALCLSLKDNPEYTRVVCYSRSWDKQNILRAKLNNHPKFRWFIGDVRDKERLALAMHRIDEIAHLAAIKEINACEYSPTETIATNIIGTENVLRVALDCEVGKVLVISSDKAVSPGPNLYGLGKAVAEHLTVNFNSYSAGRKTKYSCGRWGNVIGSTGSVIPLFQKQAKGGKLTVTSNRMTRFWLTVDDAAKFVLECLDKMEGGEIFIPHLRKAGIMDMANTISSDSEIVEIGIRPGEKVHEVLLAPEEMAHTVDLGWAYRVDPVFHFWTRKGYLVNGSPVTNYADFTSASAQRLSPEELKLMIEYTP